MVWKGLLAASVDLQTHAPTDSPLSKVYQQTKFCQIKKVQQKVSGTYV